ncbi:MAG: hypothetical protein IJ991_16255 [Thermoguttaceae bacterium]|nr:hypothetical protein [Thermoguttaceae bacterium]
MSKNIENRRTFFKKAAQAALAVPFLAVASKELPAAETQVGSSSSCGSTCTTSCGGNCHHSCIGYCKTTCGEQGCKGYCDGSCTVTCGGACVSYCSGTSK